MLAGITMALPPGWRLRTVTAVRAGDPRTLLVAASVPARPDERCRGLPILRPGRGDAAAVVLREFSASVAGERIGPGPARWGARRFAQRVRLDAEAALPGRGCAAAAPASYWRARFRDHGRAFEAIVGIGRPASRRRRPEVERIIASLEADEGMLVGTSGGPWLRIPPGWTARTLRHQPAGALAPRTVVRVGNFMLPPIGSDRGGEAAERMQAGDLTITLVVHDGPAGPDVPPLRLPVQLTRSDFADPRSERQPSTAAAVRRGRVHGRPTSVQVALGLGAAAGGRAPAEQLRPADADRLIGQANAVLLTLLPGR